MKGVHAAIVTPFDASLQIDHPALAGEIERLIGEGIHGIVANGTVGEGGSLTAQERRAVLDTVVQTAAGRVPVCAGISAPTAALASGYASDAAAVGADHLMILPPLLYRADRHELLEFFGSAGATTGLPMLIYNNPEASGSDLLPEFLAELAAEVPSIEAFKETSGDARRIAALVNLCPQIDVMVGGDDWALEGFCAGATGWISGVADVFPAACVRLWELSTAGELAPARELYAELLPLARLDMTAKLVQYFKAALDQLGPGGGPCRPPRLPLQDSELRTLRAAVDQAVNGQTLPVSRR
jgi:dihydrodipicolinate synthase/N-acetylneuraminate lyase